MKKIIFVAIVFAGMCFASCGNKTISEPKNDTTAVDSLNTLVADSVSGCDITVEGADSLFC
jgi:ABC-type oligopeptide transport system substrate-binding subunit